ncbi:MAG: hypothetical protein ACJ77K_08630 [Bacteroidia bacterium]
MRFPVTKALQDSVQQPVSDSTKTAQPTKKTSTAQDAINEETKKFQKESEQYLFRDSQSDDIDKTLSEHPEIASWEFRNEKGASSSPDNNCATCPIILGVNSPDDRYFTNGIEMKANIKGHRQGYVYDIKRKFDRIFWEKIPMKDGSEWVKTGKNKNVSDDATNNDEELFPQTKDGNEDEKTNPSKEYYIYSKDRPAIGKLRPQEKQNATEVIFASNFIESVQIINLNKKLFSSHIDKKTFHWHCLIHLKKGEAGWIMDESRSSIGDGHISLGQPTD